MKLYTEILTEPPGTSKIHETTHSQPACTAIQIVLVDILASWNVDPEGVVGHSSGKKTSSLESWSWAKFQQARSLQLMLQVS